MQQNASDSNVTSRHVRVVSFINCCNDCRK